jgi:uncharacterized cupin superfamily protein
MSIIDPKAVPERTGTIYPSPYRGAVAGRHYRRLGDAAGVSNFGVNLVRLEPGAASSHRHWHTKEDEFVWILEGTPTLVTDEGETALQPGMAAGFPKGVANGHHLVNRTATDVLFLVVGDRAPDDDAFYSDPTIDMELTGGVLRHRDGTPWETKE